MSKNIVTLKSGSEVTQGHWKLYHSVDSCMISYWCSLVTLSLKRTVFEIFDFCKYPVTLKPGLGVTQGHRKWYHSIDRLWLVFFSNFVPKTHRFWDIRLVSIPWPWNPGLGSLKVIENYTTRSGTYDFLLKFHSRPNHRPISHCFRDKRRYPSKIARKSPIFPPPVYLTPRWRGSRWIV